jgi:hypothetical protein
MVGGVFFVEGLLKFLRPGELGAGRFAKMACPRRISAGLSSAASSCSAAR